MLIKGIVKSALSDLKQSLIQLGHRALAKEKQGLRISRKAILNTPEIGRLRCGEFCSVGHFSIIDIADDPNVSTNRGRLEFGDKLYIGEHCNIRASGSLVSIGSNTMIANSVVMVSANHGIALGKSILDQPWDTKNGILIGSNCWIGSHSTILPGTRIGDGAVIAAGAVVRGEVPPFTIFGGVPAKLIKRRV